MNLTISPLDSAGGQLRQQGSWKEDYGRQEKPKPPEMFGMGNGSARLHRDPAGVVGCDEEHGLQ